MSEITAISDHVLVIDMNFGQEKTSTGIIIPNQDGKVGGVKARWGKVYAVGPEQKDVKPGDWVYVDHGRWTRGVTVEINGKETIVRRVESESMLLVTDNKPDDIYIPENL